MTPDLLSGPVLGQTIFGTSSFVNLYKHLGAKAMLTVPTKHNFKACPSEDYKYAAPLYTGLDQ